MSRRIKWTEAHRREALRRIYEIAAELVGNGRADRAAYLLTFSGFVVSEGRWRDWLVNAVIDDARVNREVRRIDALATGRLVRETVWRVRWRVTRIRRAK